MTPHCRRQAHGIGRQAGEVIAALGLALSADGAGGLDDGEAAQAFPVGFVGQPVNLFGNPVAALFVAAMLFVHGGVMGVGQIAPVMRHRIIEEGFDFVVQDAVVAFEGQHVVGIGFANHWRRSSGS